ncbi:response regulator [Wukongibacter baidiensis]
MARILIVDDSFIMRKNLKNILTKEGHTIAGEASNGKQAVIAYKETKPDLVTMDITMPTMDGIEACKQIAGENPEAKIIMISALDQKRKVFEALNNGAKHYILKPITKEKVIKIVDEVLITEGLDQAIEEKEYEKDNLEVKEPVQPFSIENNMGKFIININETIDNENFQSLKLAINGFLFIKPLNIVLDFGDAKSLDVGVLFELNNVIESIKGVGGEYSAIAKNDSFIDFAKTNGSILFG